MYKKIQTTVAVNGKAETMKLGFVDRTKLDDDMEAERERFTKLAKIGNGRIQAVEVTDATVVAVYKDGTVRIVHWIP